MPLAPGLYVMYRQKPGPTYTHARSVAIAGVLVCGDTSVRASDNLQTHTQTYDSLQVATFQVYFSHSRCSETIALTSQSGTTPTTILVDCCHTRLQLRSTRCAL